MDLSFLSSLFAIGGVPANPPDPQGEVGDAARDVYARGQDTVAVFHCVVDFIDQQAAGWVFKEIDGYNAAADCLGCTHTQVVEFPRLLGRARPGRLWLCW